MSRKIATTYTFTCDRCGKVSVFQSKNEEELKQARLWQQLNTSFLPFLGESFDFCPECYEVFQKDFMEWIPPAFRKALDK